MIGTITKNNKKNNSFFADIIAAVELPSKPLEKCNVESLTLKKQSATLTAILNRFIEKGITFDVSADDFQAIDANQTLKTSDREFLEINSAAILCTLHQSLLVKHLFSHSPEQFEDFAYEIEERESLMSKTTVVSYESHFAAVTDVTRRWFEQLISE